MGCMKLLTNKYFIFGNLALILLAIPLTMLFISRQQDLRSKAAPATTLTFSPATITTDQCTDTTTNLVITPSSGNAISNVTAFLKYDSTKFDIEITPNADAFTVLNAPVYSNGVASFTLTTGASIDKLITAATNVATIKIKPLSSTGTTTAKIEVDALKTKILSGAGTDGFTENVFSAAGSTPAQVTISAATCPGASPTPTATPSATPSPTIIATITPSASANRAPTCTSLTASPSSSGSAPFAVTLNGSGNDSDGLISKATFNFGDGTVQDVTTGMDLGTVNPQLSHTYSSGGSFSSSVVFTDNTGSLSNSCSQLITVVASSGSATITPTSAISSAPTSTPTPTIAETGGLLPTLGIISGVILAIVGGLFLLAL